MGVLFGTDGIRGIANKYPITPEMALLVGRSVAAAFKKNSQARIIIGKDTRLSGDMIESALASGICSMGGDTFLAGVLPTPAVAYLAVAGGFDAGIVVSASHNPFYDNGIKLFDHQGFKLSTEIETTIEQIILENGKSLASAPPDHIGSIRQLPDPQGKYSDFLVSAGFTGTGLRGLHIVLDCSNGATYKVAPHVFSRLGARVTTLFENPDGRNINENCGSEHTATLRRTVTELKADIGLAFDGDGDRLIAVDEKGGTVTGDQVLAICALFMKETGKLKNNLAVSTVMSNVGLKNVLAEKGIRHLIADVGDRNVLSMMRSQGAVIGGEDSGHMIFLDCHTSGDGILTGIRLIETMIASGRPLSEMAAIMRIYPQVLKNVHVREKIDIFQFPEISGRIQEVEKSLGQQGRVLVRYSGTQPLCRIMVEGPDKTVIDDYSQQIVDVIRAKIGGNEADEGA